MDYARYYKGEDKIKIFFFSVALILFVLFSTSAFAYDGGAVGSETKDGNTSTAKWGDETAMKQGYLDSH